MVLLSGSGASTAGAFVGPALVEIAKRKPFNYFVGVSYSSVIALPLALGMYEEIINTTIKLKHTDFFKVSPMTKKGRFSFMASVRAVGSIFAPNKIKSFGVQDVRPILKKFITPELFALYQNGNYPVVYIAAVNAETQNPHVWNIKNKSVNYNKYLDIVAASSRIPVWTQPQNVDGVEYYDGGVTDTNAAGLVLDMNKDIKQVYSVYSRPRGHAGKISPELNGIVGAINWTIDTMLKDVSKNDELNEIDYCQENNIKLTQIFPDKYILDNLYDVDERRLLELSQMAVNVVKRELKD